MTILLLQKDPYKRPSLLEIFRMDGMKKKMKELGYSYDEHK